MINCSVNSDVFFKENTAYEIRISAWSSDVGSSDLTKCTDLLTETAQYIVAIIQLTIARNQITRKVETRPFSRFFSAPHHSDRTGRLVRETGSASNGR